MVISAGIRTSILPAGTAAVAFAVLAMAIGCSKIRATDWDTVLLGGVWLADSRMNDRSLSRSHTFSHVTLSNQGPNSRQSGGAACGIRLQYTVSRVGK